MDCQAMIPSWSLPSGVMPISLREHFQLSPAVPPVHPSQHPPFYYDEAPREKHVLQHFQRPENPCIVYSSWAARAASCLRRRPDHLWIAWSWTSWWVRVENVQDTTEMPYPEGWCEHLVSVKSRTHLCIYMLRLRANF